MLPAIFIALIVVLLIGIAGSRRVKKVGTLNEGQENHMPVHLDGGERNKLVAYAYLAGWVIKKNARDSEAKINFVHRYFKQYFQQVDVEIGTEMTNALKYSTNIRSISRWVLSRMNAPEERLKLVDFLIDLSFVDGDLIDREYVAIARFSELIGVPIGYVEQAIEGRRNLLYEQQYEEVKELPWLKNSRLHLHRARVILQVEENASESEVKRSFRKLAARYHPDKYEQASWEEQQAAAEKFREVKQAYDYWSEEQNTKGSAGTTTSL